MAKIKLGQKPKSFKRIVSFPMLDGTQGQIEMSFIYRTRKEFGGFIDKMLEDAGRTKTSSEDFSMEELMEKTADANADYVLSVADGWNLDEDFSRANVQMLSDEVPAAVLAIMEAYRGAVTEGRLGN